MAKSTYDNGDLAQPKRITLPSTIGNVRLVECPINARSFTLTPPALACQWKNGEGVTDDTAIGTDYDTVSADAKVSFPLPGTRGGIKRNLNTPKLAIAGAGASQVVEITFF